MADSRHVQKSKNSFILATDRFISTKFDVMMQIVPLNLKGS